MVCAEDNNMQQYGACEEGRLHLLPRTRSQRAQTRKAGLFLLATSVALVACAGMMFVMIFGDGKQEMQADELLEVQKPLSAMKKHAHDKLAAANENGIDQLSKVERALEQKLNKQTASQADNLMKKSLENQGESILAKVSKGGALGEHLGKAKLAEINRESHNAKGKNKESLTATERALQSKLDQAARRKETESFKKHLALLQKQSAASASSSASAPSKASSQGSSTSSASASAGSAAQNMQQAHQEQSGQQSGNQGGTMSAIAAALRSKLNAKAHKEQERLFAKQRATYDEPKHTSNRAQFLHAETKKLMQETLQRASAADGAHKKVTMHSQSFLHAKTKKLMQETLERSKRDQPNENQHLAVDEDGIVSPKARKSFKSWLQGFRAKLARHAEKRGEQLMVDDQKQKVLSEQDKAIKSHLLQATVDASKAKALRNKT